MEITRDFIYYVNNNKSITIKDEFCLDSKSFKSFIDTIFFSNLRIFMPTLLLNIRIIRDILYPNYISYPSEIITLINLKFFELLREEVMICKLGNACRGKKIYTQEKYNNTSNFNGPLFIDKTVIKCILCQKYIYCLSCLTIFKNLNNDNNCCYLCKK